MNYVIEITKNRAKPCEIFFIEIREGEFIVSEKTYGVCVLRKYKRGAVAGIETHVERRASISHTNPEIDRSKSSKNYDLNGRFDETFKSILKSRVEQTQAKGYDRKNGVVVCELLFSASPSFFEGKSDDEIRQYFQRCYDFASEKYGKENIISSMVHLDEKTPHMHLCFAPIVQKNGEYKFCANDLFNHKLEKLQDEVQEKVFSKYNLDRGELKKTHLETLDWKIQQYTRKKEELEQQISELENTRDNSVLYKLQRDLKKTQQMLSKMFEVIESDPELMKHYKDVAQELERRESQNKNDRAIE